MSELDAEQTRPKILADINYPKPGGNNAELHAIVTDTNPKTGGLRAGHLIVGEPLPQSALATAHAERVYVDQHIVVEPGTKFRFTGPESIHPTTGRSRLILQLPDREPRQIDQPAWDTESATQTEEDLALRGQLAGSLPGGTPRVDVQRLTLSDEGPTVEEKPPRPVDGGPTSHLYRVLDGHACHLVNDPREISPADPPYRTGGGFLAFTTKDGNVSTPGWTRTRLGDALIPCKLGPPTLHVPRGSAQPVAAHAGNAEVLAEVVLEQGAREEAERSGDRTITRDEALNSPAKQVIDALKRGVDAINDSANPFRPVSPNGHNADTQPEQGFIDQLRDLGL